MILYTQTPDFYRDYIEHGWLKDQAAKVHKYIKRWRGKNGKWYYKYENTARNLKKKTKEIADDVDDIVQKVINIYKQKQKKKENKKKRIIEEKFIDLVNEERKKPWEERQHRYVGRVKTPYGYRYFYTQRAYDKYMARYNNLIDQDRNSSRLKIKTLKKQETVNESLHKVNPKYNNGENIPYSINCQRCAFTFEMRQRGFDVEAGANPSGFKENDPRHNISHKFNTDTEIYNYFEANYSERHYHQNNGDVSDAVFFDKSMKEMPNNSRGILTVDWTGYDSGHALNWVKSSNGVVSIVDSQIGKIYTPNEFFNKGTEDAILFRTDNISVSYDFVDQFAMDGNEDDLFVNSKRRKA